MMNQQKDMKLEIVPQSKQECEVEQPTRNWLDLPPGLTENILCRIGVADILESAQKVCSDWRKICKDPAMWRVVCIDREELLHRYPNHFIREDEMCKNVVDRSQGQLVDITIVDFSSSKTLMYIANRSSQLKRLTMVECIYMDVPWTEALKKFPLLEELNLYRTHITAEGIESAARYCPMLKTLKVNREDDIYWDDSDEEFDPETCKSDSVAMAIGENLHELEHLELIGSPMTNEGLEMILDGCHRLESLDLRRCLFIDLEGDLGNRCLQQIKCVKLPGDSIKGCPYIYKHVDESEGGSDEEFEGESDEESEGGSYEESEGGSYEEFVEGFDDDSDDYQR